MSKFIKVTLIVLFILGIAGGIIGFSVYKMVKLPNIKTSAIGEYIYIPTGANFEQVLDTLEDNDILANKTSFIKVSKLKKYNNLIKPGRYYIEKEYSNNEFVNLLRSGNQSALNVTVPSVRTIKKLSVSVSKYFEFDSTDLLVLLEDDSFIESIGYNTETIISLFIPNTYQMYWNTTPEEFIERMQKEYNNFWTEERLQKAEDLNMTPLEVSTLASIVQAEQSQYVDERPIIAGLYLNRLKKGMLLQSDPTLVFAHQDFTIKRVYDYHKEIESPYNTYKYAGLPPGPILIPEISSIDAVLNAETNNYLYMCAKEDFSGYHNFATNLSEHNMYARRYHNALNQRNIR